MVVLVERLRVDIEGGIRTQNLREVLVRTCQEWGESLARVIVLCVFGDFLVEGVDEAISPYMNPPWAHGIKESESFLRELLVVSIVSQTPLEL